MSPPFDPKRIAAALDQAAGGNARDDEVVETVGLPAAPTRCAVAVDLAELASGKPTKIRMSAHVEQEGGPRGVLLVLSRFPLGVGAEEAGEAIAARFDASRHIHGATSGLRARMTIPVRDVVNESAGDVTRLVCELLPDADIELCQARLLETWPVTIEQRVQLRAPLATLVRQFADEADPAAQHDAMRALLGSAP
jgi:hypothetical protein